MPLPQLTPPFTPPPPLLALFCSLGAHEFCEILTRNIQRGIDTAFQRETDLQHQLEVERAAKEAAMSRAEFYYAALHENVCRLALLLVIPQTHYSLGDDKQQGKTANFLV